MTATKDMGFYTVRYPYSGNQLVSIVIPSRDEVETLKNVLQPFKNALCKL